MPPNSHIGAGWWQGRGGVAGGAPTNDTMLPCRRRVDGRDCLEIHEWIRRAALPGSQRTCFSLNSKRLRRAQNHRIKSVSTGKSRGQTSAFIPCKTGQFIVVECLTPTTATAAATQLSGAEKSEVGPNSPENRPKSVTLLDPVCNVKTSRPRRKPPSDFDEYCPGRMDIEKRESRKLASSLLCTERPPAGEKSAQDAGAK
ncbi:hypothetical protein B0H14DRAFT_2659370, partial [Mycena olivaceomarginata]